MNESSNAAPTATTAEAPRPAKGTRLKRLRLPLMIGGTLVIVAVAAYYLILQRGYESTEDAYVNAARVSISTNVPGRVVAVAVHDNQQVQRGQELFRLDEQPFEIAVEQARARLGAARLQIESLKATYRQKTSELRSAEDTLKYEQSEADRQRRLLASGIASQAQLDRAVHARDSAQQAAAAAQQEIASVSAQLGGDPDVDPARHPAVEQAQAALDAAELDLSYATVKAPDDGIVTQVERLQVGDYVNAATPVFALVAVRDAWVEANFKEVQVAKMRPGQPATVDIDAYGGRTFKAHVASFSPGTGSQFSMLPAQNATGNWVKVVQRLAVRVELDAPDPAYPLYAGLSATVKVDTRAAPATAPDSTPPRADGQPVVSRAGAD